MERRAFFTKTGLIAAGCLVSGAKAAGANQRLNAPDDALGVLVDTTLCIGCRRCEKACDRSHNLSGKPDSFFKDETVFNTRRRLSTTSLTIVNRHENPKKPGKPVFAKTQCMHCVRPACVSACIVGALEKRPDGAVTYDYEKCIGCRYCMVACPFQIPAYEYFENLTPRVMKCDFCFGKIRRDDGLPACVDACPVSALIFGRRGRLLEMAGERIRNNPGRYVNHIYGEFEAGGASWLYLSSLPFEKFGLPKLGDKAPPALSEGLQHGVFKHWIPPVSLYLLLSMAMWVFTRREIVPLGQPEAAAGRGDSE